MRGGWWPKIMISLGFRRRDQKSNEIHIFGGNRTQHGQSMLGAPAIIVPAKTGA